MTGFACALREGAEIVGGPKSSAALADAYGPPDAPHPHICTSHSTLPKDLAFQGKFARNSGCLSLWAESVGEPIKITGDPAHFNGSFHTHREDVESKKGRPPAQPPSPPKALRAPPGRPALHLRRAHVPHAHQAILAGGCEHVAGGRPRRAHAGVTRQGVGAGAHEAAGVPLIEVAAGHRAQGLALRGAILGAPCGEGRWELKTKP